MSYITPKRVAAVVGVFLIFAIILVLAHAQGPADTYATRAAQNAKDDAAYAAYAPDTNTGDPCLDGWNHPDNHVAQSYAVSAQLADSDILVRAPNNCVVVIVRDGLAWQFEEVEYDVYTLIWSGYAAQAGELTANTWNATPDANHDGLLVPKKAA